MGIVAKLFETDASPRFVPEDIRIVEALLFAAAAPRRSPRRSARRGFPRNPRSPR